MLTLRSLKSENDQVNIKYMIRKILKHSFHLLKTQEQNNTMETDVDENKVEELASHGF